MSKPFMCGDEPAIYIPSGGCECNYTMVRVDDDDFYATYKLMRDGSSVGETIQVPHDKVLVSGTVEVVTVANSPYYGAAVGDYYLDMVIDYQDTHVYIPLDSLKSGGYIILDDISELPEVGEPQYIYLVPDGAGYAQYVWSDNDWVNIGSTNIDLTDYYTKTQVDALIAQMSLVAYPVGSLYMSVNSTDPTNFFGGTWEQIEDRFLLAAGSTYTAGTTGGSADAVIVSHNHNIQSRHTAEDGNHRHELPTVFSAGSGSSNAYVASTNRYATTLMTHNDGVHDHLIPAHSTDSKGVSGTGKNMPPYLTVYVWKRTA